MNKRSKEKNIIKDMALISLGTAFLAICSYISVPALFGVSFTLQLFAIFFISGSFGIKISLCTVLLYLISGIIGLPVFSAFRSGLSVFLGASGGYLLAFIPCVLIISSSVRFFGKKFPSLFISMFISLILCHTLGTLWMFTVAGVPIGSESFLGILAINVFPFIIPDILKIILATYLCRRFEKITDSL